MRKNFLKLFVLCVCAFALCMNVNATSNVVFSPVTYCYNADGTFAKQLNVADTTCSGYYGGTVHKKIGSQDAYCTQKTRSIVSGTACNVAGYNSKAWMNSHWTEANAIKLGYAAQFIKSKGYSHADEYTYITNIANQILQFNGSAPIRTLNSRLSDAITYANTSYNNYVKANGQSSNSSVSAGFVNKTLIDIDGTYSKGEVEVKAVNSNPLANMTVTAECTNCTLYTDSGLTKEFKSADVKPSGTENFKLYVKSKANLAASTKVTVNVVGTVKEVSYPIVLLWDCGDNAQSLVTLSSKSIIPFSSAVTTVANVPEVKKYCQVENGKYYGKDGNEVTEKVYRDECLKICKVENGKYYGKDGNEVTEKVYKDECLKICKVEKGKYYGKDGNEVTEKVYKEECLKICKVEKGKYYGKDGNEVTEEVYRDECLKICKVENGKYYGKDGNEVTEKVYRDECLKICKVENGKYYGKNGDEITSDQYKIQCLTPSEEVRVPSTGTTASNIPFALGLSAIATGFGFVFYKKKRVN